MVNLEGRINCDNTISTRWYVITGAPCSGKTAVIEALARRGYSVVQEVARAYIEEQLASGLSMLQIRGDEHAFERCLLEKKAAIERKLNVRDIIFLDRAVPDSIAYYRFAGLDPSEPVAFSRHVRYKKIFLLERLPVKTDAVRKEDDPSAEALETLLIECYQALGYRLIRIPVSTVSQRTDTILQHLD